MALLISLILNAATTFGAKQLWLLAQPVRDRLISPSDAWDIAVMAFVFLVTAVFWFATWKGRAQAVKVRARRK